MKKKLKNLGQGGGRGVGFLKPPFVFFFWNSPLLNGLNPNLGNIAYSGKFSKLGEKKYQIKRKKNKQYTLSKIAAPGRTSSASFEAFYQIKMKAVFLA